MLVILATALGLSRGELAGVKRNVGRMGVCRPLRGEERTVGRKKAVKAWIQE